MKHLLAALVTLLAVLPREQDLVLGSKTPCPRRYLRRINGKCYYFSVTKMNWFGALNNCLRKGLTLADLSNPRDFDGAVGFLSSLGNTEDFWFGGNDLYHEGRFTYISNGRLVRYYSNFSDVLPAEQSECDDCLEVRVRAHVNMVAADNCLERQYFICSERYCEPGCGDDAKGKPKHHSHEHLHHFHHDIGESNEAVEEGDALALAHSNMSPITNGSKEQADNSEVAIDGGDATDAGDLNGSPTTTSSEGEHSTTSGDATTAAGGDNATPKQDETTAAAGGEETTAAARGEKITAAAAGEEETTAAAAGGEETTAAAAGGEETTAAAGGEETTAAAGGEETTAAAGGEETTAAAAGGEETTAAAGGEETTAAAAGGEETTAAAGGEETTAAAGGEKTTAAAAGGEETTAAAAGGEETTAAAAGREETTAAAAGGEETTAAAAVPPGANN